MQLIERVLHLLLLLVNFGYYSKPEDIQKLMGPLLDTIDSRDDRLTARHVPKANPAVTFGTVRGRSRPSLEAEMTADEVVLRMINCY